MRLPQGAFVTYISHINYELINDAWVAIGECVYVVLQIGTKSELNT